MYTLSAIVNILLSGQTEKAKNLALQWITKYPKDLQGWLLLAQIQAQSGDLQGVLSACQRVCEIDPENSMALYNLGVSAQALGYLDIAINSYRRILTLNPTHHGSWTNLICALNDAGKHVEAVESGRVAVKAMPNSSLAHNNFGLALKNNGNLEEAELEINKALDIEPLMPEARYNLGLVRLALGDPTLALSDFNTAIELRESYAEAWSDRGVALQALGHLDEALRSYDRAIDISPDFADAHWNRAIIWLLMGNYSDGWEEYEWRWKRPSSPPRGYSQPLWDKPTRTSGHLFIYAEQGIGDALQFTRYLRTAREFCDQLTFECHEGLHPILENCEFIDTLLKPGLMPRKFDYHTPLMSLPRIFSTTLTNIPAPDACLNHRHFRNLVPYPDNKSSRSIKVGIVWAGNPLHTNDRNRSCPLEYFTRLSRLDGIQLHSLQCGEHASREISSLDNHSIVDLSKHINNYKDTARLITGLDLVISVDTSVVHLSGTLGMPTWVLLPYAPDWRWLTNRTDSPWYPTIRTYRQPAIGDWHSVFDDVERDLRQAVMDNS